MDTAPISKTTKHLLELTSTVDLMQELFSRYETVVFAGHAPWVPEAGLEKIRVNWQGNLRTALAIASRLEHLLNVKLDECEADAVEEG